MGFLQFLKEIQFFCCTFLSPGSFRILISKILWPDRLNLPAILSRYLLMSQAWYCDIKSYESQCIRPDAILFLHYIVPYITNPCDYQPPKISIFNTGLKVVLRSRSSHFQGGSGFNFFVFRSQELDFQCLKPEPHCFVWRSRPDLAGAGSETSDCRKLKRVGSATLIMMNVKYLTISTWCRPAADRDEHGDHQQAPHRPQRVHRVGPGRFGRYKDESRSRTNSVFFSHVIRL